MNKKLVYHLDDDQDQRILLAAICKDILQIEYQGFESTKDFLSSLKNKRPSVCIIDLNLNEGRGAGFLVIEAIKSQYCTELPILILSRRGSPEDISYGIDLGVDDYIIKPLDAELISSKIKYLIEPDFKSQFPLYEIKNTIKSMIEVNLKPLKADHSYLYFESEHYFLKHTQIEIENDLINDIFGVNKETFLVHDCILIEESKNYVLKLIKWNADDKYFESIYSYLLRNA